VDELRKLFAKTFSTDAGAEVLKHLEEQVLFGPSYVKGDVNETLYNEGRRSMVFYIRELVKHGG
jgi:hypothetical protein|tara:strand:+ start:436 stop:627 length:192 start_codon:yes stop_codon:yes gene_type:complete